jgi:phytoene dehydrogenase-like protein
VNLAVKSDRRSVVRAGAFWQSGSDGPENQPPHARFNNLSATPIPKNTRFRSATIYLAGAGARRGGGVSGIAGHNAAMALLTRNPLSRPSVWLGRV